MPEQQLRFEQWVDFYVITSTPAVTLLGVLSVVPNRGLDLVAAGMLVLLVIAVRNSWAIATTLMSPQD